MVCMVNVLHIDYTTWYVPSFLLPAMATKQETTTPITYRIKRRKCICAMTVRRGSLAVLLASVGNNHD